MERECCECADKRCMKYKTALAAFQHVIGRLFRAPCDASTSENHQLQTPAKWERLGIPRNIILMLDSFCARRHCVACFRPTLANEKPQLVML